MCQKPRIVPKDGEIEVSKAPPAAKNLEYQRLATEAEKAVPQIWWRKGYRDNKLFLSDKSSQPFVFLGNRPVRTKKLRNIYQCVTRQDFIRQARNFTLAKSLPIGEVSLKHKSKSKCATLSNSIVQLFAKLSTNLKYEIYYRMLYRYLHVQLLVFIGLQLYMQSTKFSN